MDPLINGLYAIPILGLLFQLGGYLIQIVPPVAPIILQSATPLALGAMVGVIGERSGVVNIGIEGTMLASAFTGWVVGVALAPTLGGDPSPFFGFTPALVIGVIAAVIVAVVIAALHAGLSITVLHGDMPRPPTKEKLGDPAIKELTAIGAEKAP